MSDQKQTQAQLRKSQGLPPLPLTVEQVVAVVRDLETITTDSGDEESPLYLLTHRVPPGVDPAARVKAEFLTRVATAAQSCPLIDQEQATVLLGTMLGGYNIDSLIALLDDEVTAKAAAKALGNTLLMYDAFNQVLEKSAHNAYALDVVNAWSDATWFTRRAAVAEKLTMTVFKVSGEINTDDFSPATEAWSRPDIPLHAESMLVNQIPDALEQIVQLKEKGHPIVFVGDVVGTGSSRKSAINSLLWHIGKDIPYVPNKRQGGVILGGKIAPIFFNTAEDSGALPIECNVTDLNSGDVVHIYPQEGCIRNEAGAVISEFSLRPTTMLDEVRAGGRINLIIGRALTDKTREALDLAPTDEFVRPLPEVASDSGFTLAQKMVGKACGVEGVRPGTYCEPRMATVGSQDTTGAMTRDELKELACLGFSAELVMQSFCHTAAYPKPVDIQLQHSLPEFMTSRGGVALRPGDGIIHSWLNRMILPDTVGTGGDSHTRFPLGISFPAGSGLVAFAAALGVMPLDMPESVLVRFSGERQPGITLRDLVHAIPYVAIQQGLLTVGKENKKNIFSGRVLEIEGLPDLKVEQAFELSDASAERSANGCSVKLNKEPIKEYLQSNIALLRQMIKDGYQSATTLERRIVQMEKWLANPVLLEADNNAEYAAVIDVDLNTITEPLLACPNDPDDIRPLSAVVGNPVDEVFIGSCMTNIGHYRAAGKVLEGAQNVPTRLWVVPPTRMDEKQLIEEGFYATFGKAGARTETPGCSLCMGNQARVADGANVLSTSTRNFPNRLGKDARVYLASAELCAVASKLAKIPDVDTYRQAVAHLDPLADEIYHYLNFHEMTDYNA